jgi:hypothetical protein
MAMVKQALLSLIFLLTLFTGAKAHPVDFYFYSMPASVLPVLPDQSRRDLVDFYNNQRASVMPAAFNGEVVLKQLTDSYLKLQTSAVSTMQLKVLTGGVSTKERILVIKTVSGPYVSSVAQLYSADWKPLNTDSIPVVQAIDFMDPSQLSTEKLNRVVSVFSPLFLTMEANPQNENITIRNDFKTTISIELLRPYLTSLKDSVILVKDSGKWIKKPSL